MKELLTLLFVCGGILFTDCTAQNLDKPRVIVLTDIESEPDDAMSLGWFLLYSNQFDVEVLVATTSVHQRNKIADWQIKEILEAYQKVQPNLLEYESEYPSYDELLSIGKPVYGLNDVGDDKDSEGSDWIIEALKRDDPRPVWITVWGGANCLSQALHKIQRTETIETAQKLYDKLRFYTISDQGNSGPWIHENFPSIFYIVSPRIWKDNHDGYFYATWAGISGDLHHNLASGADTKIIDNGWVDENIQQNHGPLSEQYPDIEYLMEGNSPSFSYLINNGLNNLEKPNHGGWSGRYELYQPFTQRCFSSPETHPIWTNTIDKVMGNDGKFYANNQATIWRWREHFQNDFAARIDWTIQPVEKANHPPVVNTKLMREAYQSNEVISINAGISINPGNDELTFKWFQYQEAGSSTLLLDIKSKNASETEVKLPNMNKAESFHLMLQITDSGTPR
jgi:hypothetical protein